MNYMKMTKVQLAELLIDREERIDTLEYELQEAQTEVEGLKAQLEGYVCEIKQLRHCLQPDMLEQFTEKSDEVVVSSNKVWSVPKFCIVPKPRQVEDRTTLYDIFHGGHMPFMSVHDLRFSQTASLEAVITHVKTRGLKDIRGVNYPSMHNAWQALDSSSKELFFMLMVAGRRASGAKARSLFVNIFTWSLQTPKQTFYI